MRGGGRAWALSLGLLLGCHDNSAAPIHLVLGPAPSDDVTFVPHASLADLIELSPTESTLLLTLTSAERSCEGLPAPDTDAIGVSLRLVLPGGSKLEPGKYPVVVNGQSPDKPHALATVKLHGHRYELQAGGELELRQADPSPQGSLEGLLQLEFSGDVEHPATRVSGRFLAHFCRINRLR
jgi:hypothetical protein